MSSGSDGEHSGASGPDDAAPASAAEVTSFVERAKALSGGDLIRLAGPPPSAARAAAGLKVSHGMIAAAVALVLGGGFVVGAQLLSGPSVPVVATAQVNPPPDPTAQLVHHLEDQVHTLKVSLDSLRANADTSRQDDAIRGLKRSVEVLKQDLEAAKANAAAPASQAASKTDRDQTAKLAEITARLDRLDRGDKTPNPKLAEITARLDEMKPEANATKLAEITARLDRVEHAVSSATPTASIAPSKPAAAPVAALVPAKPAAVEGWMLRDVYGGVALLEGRFGSLREVSPGQFVPGIGEIRSIERRGRGWVVVTSRGIIEASNR